MSVSKHLHMSLPIFMLMPIFAYVYLHVYMCVYGYGCVKPCHSAKCIPMIRSIKTQNLMR